MLSDAQIKEYQELYRKKYGEDISYDEAVEQGTNLVRLLKVVYGDEAEEIELPYQSD